MDDGFVGEYWGNVFKFMKDHNVRSFSFQGMTVEFRDEITHHEPPHIHAVDLAKDMPANDEMLFYATDEFDRMIAEREAAKNAPLDF